MDWLTERVDREAVEALAPMRQGKHEGQELQHSPPVHFIIAEHSEYNTEASVLNETAF
jgi:hypothetical protein